MNVESGIYTEIQENERARKGVAALLNDTGYSNVVEVCWITFRILWG